MNLIRQFASRQNKIFSALRNPNFLKRFTKSVNLCKVNLILAGTYLSDASKIGEIYNKFDINDVKRPFVRRSQEKIDIPEEDCESAVKRGCIEIEKRVNILMKQLQKSIRKSCEKYRECVSRQIEILNHGLHKKKEEHWLELLKSRDEAEELRKEFERYQGMIEYVGQLAFNLAICAALMHNLDAQDMVCDEFCLLQKLNQQQISLNKACEQRLFELDLKEVFPKKPS